MKLHPRTTATLQALRAVEWFRAVGHAEGTNIVTVATWAEAMEWSGGAWRDVQLEAANQVTEALLAKSIQDFRKWNEAVNAIKPIVVELVRTKTKAVADRENLEASFENSVAWDILHLALEAQFSDVIQPGFFAQLGYWYEKGNWPCGWQGPIERGKLVVF
jgi:hypothetical protein